MGQYISYLEFEKTRNSVKRKVLYSIPTNFGIPMKIVVLIKTCLNET
jgi:hypothetical protein